MTTKNTVSASRIQLDTLGYIKNGQAHAGRYFGVGEKLWRVFSDDDRQIDVYVRAGNKKTAIALVVGGAE